MHRNGAGEGDSEFLQQNYPNPFTDETTVNCYIPYTAKNASLAIYDANGILVKTCIITDRNQTSVTITGEDISAGTYIYSLIIDNKQVGSKQMIIND